MVNWQSVSLCQQLNTTTLF